MPPLTEGSVPEDAPQGPDETPAETAGEASRPDFTVLPGRRDPDESGPEDETAETAETDGSEPGPRRYPSTIGGAFYLVILAATVVSLVIVSTGRWRTGVHWLGGALVGAAVLRAVLRSRDAGMLAVRNRWFDVSLLAVVGVVLWILATSIPDA